jgi:hypothetical protein
LHIVAGGHAVAGARTDREKAFVVRKWDRAMKKEPPETAARSSNREASNRVDRSHSMSRRWTLPVMIAKA